MMFFNKHIVLKLLICVCTGECIRSCAPVHQTCPTTKYRSFDGSCNNLDHPDWGMPFTKFRRLIAPVYGDGISSYRKAKSGKELPNARKISQKIYPDIFIEDPELTLSFMQYGQFVTHDMASISADPFLLYCCTEDLQFLNKSPSPKCAPIIIPENDPFYSEYGAKCISFARVLTDRDHGCGTYDRPVEQITTVNSYLDLSVIYGNDKDINNFVRLFKDGLLKTTKDRSQEWPMKSTQPSRNCPLLKGNKTCFYPIDGRINQNPQLTLLHIIFYREHNRLAKELANINPHWDDDTIFEEARKINIAQHQWISYYEWLPMLLNTDQLLFNEIVYDDPTNFLNDYDAQVDAGVLTEHNNAAFRIHTLISGHLNLVEEDRNYNQSLRLSDWYFRPNILEEGDNFDLLTRGLTSQSSLSSNQFHDKEITLYWFRRGKLGFDLKAIDIERSRDVGIPPYNKIRALCDLPQATTFDEMTDIPPHIVLQLQNLYESPEDVDFIVGGSVEHLVPGARVGPTFHCILIEQFFRTRIGDRFWFERSGYTGFTLNQLNEIRRKTSLSRLLCDNTEHVTMMQRKAFQKLHETNPLQPCDALPDLNFNLWKD